MDVPALAIQDAQMRSLLPLIVAVLLPHLAAAQPVSLHDNVLQDWTRLKDTMMKIAAAMPDDKFEYRATPPERTWGEQILHVAEANIVQMGRLGAKVPPPAYDMKETSRAAIMKTLEASFDYGVAALKEQTDQSLLAQASSTRFDRFMGSFDESPRRVLRHRPHVGHLRPDGGVSPAQRHHAAGQSAVLRRQPGERPLLRKSLKAIPAFRSEMATGR